MTAIILAFPADRCRQPLSVIGAAERATYEIHEAEPGNHNSGVAMIRLALEGACAVTKERAAAWLYRELNIQVS